MSLKYFGTLLLGTAFAFPSIAQGSGEDLQVLKQQIESLTKKIQVLETKQKKAEQKQETLQKEYQEIKVGKEKGDLEGVIKKQMDKKTPPGYIDLPGLKTLLKFYGQLRMDTIYDANAPTGDVAIMSGLPIKQSDANASRSALFRMHARATRLGFMTITDTPKGDVKTQFEMDFLGSNNFGSTFNSTNSTSSSSYNLRLRHAFVEFKNFLVGQTWSNFADMDSLGGVIEFNSVTGVSLNRQAQIRYTHNFNPNWSLAGAVENGNPDYVDNTGTRKEFDSTINGTLGDGYQTVPDFTAKLKFKGEKGHIALRGLLRQERIKKVSSPAYAGSQWGYGVGISGKYFINGTKSNLYSQLNFGNAVARYIYGLEGLSMAFYPPVGIYPGQMALQNALGFASGIEHWWNDQWRSNIAYGFSRVQLASFLPKRSAASTYEITKQLKQVFINTIYSPIPCFDIALEYGHFLRDVNSGRHGVGNRVQVMVSYKF